jgi:CBS domain containing-hemolysin-like protein
VSPAAERGEESMSKSFLHRGLATLARIVAVLAGSLLLTSPARASFLSGDALATAADVMAIVVIVIVPIVVIVLFWLVHVLPEKIAHKRHHPQTEAIQVLCLMSLVFGGLLWPLAWLWAYTKPVFYRMAYGRDRVDEPLPAPVDTAPPSRGALHADVARLRSDLDSLIARSDSPEELQAIRRQLAALEPRLQARAEEVR